ncbi:uncharacterized protein N7503_007174 [Penicillium pulvis]|uniref:uncharacterized protein n=1 Tax=Penicillium pulvis TaxID=1562058 RepID=UPI002546D595|nr:uncharacterized protein N7503_007174 [Penicillium pulvis]KAJ5797878.1 hypothetical protein N7503_007174 [Penicillium pulvis]
MPRLSILVFVASPLDYARYRHTSLFFEFEPEAEAGTNHTQTGADAEYIKSSLMEVIGSPGFMSFSERKNWGTPVASNTLYRAIHLREKPLTKLFAACLDLARVIPVSTLPSSIPISALRSTVSETLIRDGDGDTDWNGQNWVGDALGRLVGAGYLDSEARDRGLDAMVDVIMEAADEEASVVGT